MNSEPDFITNRLYACRALSVYMTPGIHERVKANNVEAAGVAPVILTARIIADQTVRVLEGKQEHFDIGTLGRVYTTKDITEMRVGDVTAPFGFSPVLDLDNRGRFPRARRQESATWRSTGRRGDSVRWHPGTSSPRHLTGQLTRYLNRTDRVLATRWAAALAASRIGRIR